MIDMSGLEEDVAIIRSWTIKFPVEDDFRAACGRLRNPREAAAEPVLATSPLAPTGLALEK